MSVLCGVEMNEHETNGDRHDGSHPPTCLLSVTLPVIVVCLQSRSPMMNIAVFVLYGLVMNTIPP